MRLTINRRIRLTQLGVVLLEQGKASQALAYMERALELEPDHQASLLNSAIVLQEMAASDKGSTDFVGERPIDDGGDVGGDVVDASVTELRRREATKRLVRLLELDPANDRAQFNLGMLAMDNGDTAAAEHHFKASVELKASFRSALFNLALLLSDTGRPLEAVPFLKQLVHYHVDHIKGLILLGDIYINSQKDLDAAEAVSQRLISSSTISSLSLYIYMHVYNVLFICRLTVLCAHPRSGSDERAGPSQSVRRVRGAGRLEPGGKVSAAGAPVGAARRLHRPTLAHRADAHRQTDDQRTDEEATSGRQYQGSWSFVIKPTDLSEYISIQAYRNARTYIRLFSLFSSVRFNLTRNFPLR